MFVIDGVGSDWSAVSGWRPNRGKREGDADIKGVRSVGDTNNRLLCVRVDYWKAFQQDDRADETYATLDFDWIETVR